MPSLLRPRPHLLPLHLSASRPEDRLRTARHLPVAMELLRCRKIRALIMGQVELPASSGCHRQSGLLSPRPKTGASVCRFEVKSIIYSDTFAQLIPEDRCGPSSGLHERCQTGRIRCGPSSGLHERCQTDRSLPGLVFQMSGEANTTDKRQASRDAGRSHTSDNSLPSHAPCSRLHEMKKQPDSPPRPAAHEMIRLLTPCCHDSQSVLHVERAADALGSLARCHMLSTLLRTSVIACHTIILAATGSFLSPR